MAVKIKNRTYNNNYRPETVNWLLGNTGDWQKVTLEVEFAVEKQLTDADRVFIENGNDLILANGGDWYSLGFDIGDVITISFRYREYKANGDLDTTLNFTFSVNIVDIQGDKMVIDGTDFANADFNMLPYRATRQVVDNVLIISNKRPEACEITYGHIENSQADSGNLSSFIDGSFTRFLAKDIDTLAVSASSQMLPLGLQSGMSISNANITYIGNVNHVYTYEIELEYMLDSFFEDLTNFEDNEPPSQVFNAASLTDNFYIKAYPKFNNPNVRIENKISETKRLGNTGWFNENFNGLPSGMSLKSLEYFDPITFDPISYLSYSGEVRIKAIIEGVQNLVNGQGNYGFGFMWLPSEESFYKSLSTPFHKNMFVNTAGGYGVGSFQLSLVSGATTYTGFSNDPNIRMDVKDVHFYQDTGDLVLEATFVPSSGFESFMEALGEDDRNYCIWASVADRTKETNNSDRVNLLLDYNVLQDLPVIIGAYDNMDIDFYNHIEDGGSSTGNCDSATFFVEDDVLAKVGFLVDLSNIPTAQEFAIEAIDTNTGERYRLDSYRVDLTGFPKDANGVPQWAFNDVRGFKYEAGNNKNWVKINREASLDSGGLYGYESFFGFKVRWEDWIERIGVPNVFFDANELNNGFNNDWFGYFQTLGVELRFCVYTEVEINGDNVEYLNEVNLTIRDYEDEAEIDSSFSYYRDSDNTLLNAGNDPVTGEPIGVILSNEYTRIEVIHELLVGVWTSIDEVYGTICLELDKGAGQFEHRQLSSFIGSETDNPLIPIAGETKLKKTLLSPTQIKFECLIDHNKLTEGGRYKVTSRIGCKNIDLGVYVGFDVTGDGFIDVDGEAVFSGDAVGTFSATQIIRFGDTVTPITSGQVTYRIMGEDINSLPVSLGEATFNIGDNLSTATPISQDSNWGANNIQSYIGGAVTANDNVVFTFAKRLFATTENYTGSYAARNDVKIWIEIEVLTNSNRASLRRVEERGATQLILFMDEHTGKDEIATHQNAVNAYMMLVNYDGFALFKDKNLAVPPITTTNGGIMYSGFEDLVYIGRSNSGVNVDSISYDYDTNISAANQHQEANFVLQKDPRVQALGGVNGRDVVWSGRSFNPIPNQNLRMQGHYWDGASWINVPFADVLGAAGFYGYIPFNIDFFPNSNDLLVSLIDVSLVNAYYIKLTYSGAPLTAGNIVSEYLNIANWTASQLFGGVRADVDGIGALIRFNVSYGSSFDNDTDFYFSDGGNDKIKKATYDTLTGQYIVTTVIGAAGAGYIDGGVLTARFDTPTDIITRGTDLYIIDYFNYSIRVLDLNLLEVTTLIGDGLPSNRDKLVY